MCDEVWELSYGLDTGNIKIVTQTQVPEQTQTRGAAGWQRCGGAALWGDSKMSAQYLSHCFERFPCIISCFPHTEALRIWMTSQGHTAGQWQSRDLNPGMELQN